MNLRFIRWVDIYIGIPLVYLFFCAGKLFRCRRHRDAGKPPKKILLIKFWGIGNIIMLLPAARALKERFPGAALDILTLTTNKAPAESSGLFDAAHLIDNNNLRAFLATAWESYRGLKKAGYDLIIDFEQFARFSALYSTLLNCPKTIGFNTKGQCRGFLYTHPVNYNNGIHITKSFYSLAERAGCLSKAEIEAVPVISGKKHRDEALNLLSEWGCVNERLIIMHTGTSRNFSLRRWPPEYYAELADRLADNFAVKTVFTGTGEESGLSEEAMSYMKNRASAVNAAGRLDFYRFTALLKLSVLLVSADTAPVHLASSLAVPVCGLYGPNTPLLYGPWGAKSIYFYKRLSCSPCITNYNAKINKCRHPQGKGACMKSITPAEVFAGIKTAYFNGSSPYRAGKNLTNI